MRHKADEFTPPQRTGHDLQRAHQNHRRKQIFDAVLGNQGHHHNGQSTCRTGNHTRTATDQRGDQAHHERRIEAHQRVHACHKGKGNRFGNKREGNGQTGQHLGLQTRRGQFFRRQQVKFIQRKLIGKTCQKGAGHGLSCRDGIFGFGPRLVAYSSDFHPSYRNNAQLHHYDRTLRAELRHPCAAGGHAPQRACAARGIEHAARGNRRVRSVRH